ncbi:DUF4003 domain-containing protein [Bacillus sp. FJAT-49732]|uniref:DUF4003 domain-containing protein n=1 Tax=Lederbergia citrisecunda TaxID=2833583 RepID=A0A942TJ41_9BACI|nr:DUF4003 family protein [Lederbergia citrisecunda]MBS4198565.1 DUF4003 domain-containing protein [Lederbergia citrisecunda]
MNNIIDNYIQIFEQLRKEMKWKVSDKKILMMIASLYAMNKKDFQIERFLKIADEIKDRSGYFSYMRSESRYTAAAILDVNYDDPETKVSSLFEIYEDMIKEKFSRGIFTYIAASVLLKITVDLDYHSLIVKGKETYNAMKKEHPFLTSSEDYPLAVLLASENRENVIQRSEYFYDQLNQNGFYKGNNLQFISHILSLNNEESEKDLLNRTVYVFDSFKEKGIKPKATYYPTMGMLALLPNEELDMEIITDVYDRFNQEKHFKWQKDINLILAVSFYVKDKLKQPNLTETSLYTTMETILQAQQAAMAGSVAAAAAASSNH